MDLPEAFVKDTRKLMGETLLHQFLDGLQQASPVSIRTNPFKYTLNPADIPAFKGKVPWCRTGIYLKERPAFTFDPLLHAGLYYVQEASSMFLDHILRQVVHHPVTLLDLCAAPGGKTLCAMSALPPGSIVFSNEPIRNRAQILNENILKFGHPDIIATRNLPRDYQNSGLLFDVILTDVPCSGEGMFRKDPDSIREWNPRKPRQCQQLQREILTEIWPCLKPGGILVYSTCTFNSLENEENVLWIARELGADFLNVHTEVRWNITGALGTPPDTPISVYRFIPGKTLGEGLFLAVLKKQGSSPDPVPPTGKEIEGKAKRHLTVLSHGIREDIRKGKDLVPDISKALSILPDQHPYPSIGLDDLQALSYLRKESLVLPSSAPRGIILVTYKSQPLGFVKNIGKRANNLYPQEWKIKSSHIPETNHSVIDL